MFPVPGFPSGMIEYHAGCLIVTKGLDNEYKHNTIKHGSLFAFGGFLME